MIRRAEIRDIPDILKLLVQVCMVHHEGRPDLFNGPGTKYTRGELEVILRDERRPVFVLTDEADAHVLGQVRTGVRTLHIHDLCVDAAARRQHVGTRLYGHVLAYARSLGCHNVTLNVWACNPGAIRFYEQVGMRVQKLGMETLLTP